MANSAASTLITRCLDNLSRASVGVTRSGTTLADKGLEWLNTACQRLARLYDFGEMLTTSTNIAGTSVTVASTKTYTFPDDYNTVYDIRLIDGTESVKLRLTSYQTFDKRVPYPEADTTGLPLWYMPWGSNFDLYPIPDAAYVMNIKYSKVPDIITSSASLVEYTPDKDDILVAAMTIEGFTYLQMFEDASLWDRIFKAKLKECISADSDDPDWNPIGRGFDSGRYQNYLGDYWNNPFVRNGQL